MAEIEKKFVFS